MMRIPLLLLTAATLLPASDLTIVIRKNPGPLDRLAAQELTRYLARMGNGHPRVAEPGERGSVYLGVLPPGLDEAGERGILKDLRAGDPDSFVIRSVGGVLLIYGNSPRANLYGAYHYLETLGVRWYYPGADNEIVPLAPARLDGYDIREVPSFHKRGIIIFPNTQGLDDIVKFAARMKLNTIGLHSSEGFEAAARRIAAWGLKADLEKHFFGESFCPDDLRSLEKERRRFLEFVKTMPADMNEIFLWVADRYLPPCASPAYADYNVSDLVLGFSKQMGRSLREVRPQARFAFLAYLSTWEAPKHEKPDGRVFLEWAPISQSFVHSIEDPASAINRKLRRSLESMIALFGASNTQVLGYWLDDTLFSRAHYGKLPYNPRALEADLRFYRQAGIPAVTTFGVMTGRDYFLQHASPAVFLYPRLVWNVGADTRKLMREYCREYFGDESVLKIYDLLAEADTMVGVEEGRVLYREVGSPDFVGRIAGALRASQELLARQREPVSRARVARLIAEVASRHVDRVEGW